MSSDSSVALPVPQKSNRLEDTLRSMIVDVVARATPQDIVAANTIVSSQSIRIETINPVVAALIFEKHNHTNRGLTPSRVYDYAEAMKRGEWKLHHQGLAFYPDRTLADGQHRMAAVVLSGRESAFTVYPNFNKEAIDAIDRTVRRTAGEALQMMGYADGKVKAAVAKLAMEYVTELDQGKRLKFTDPQIERFVIENDDSLTESIRIGRDSTKNVSDPCLGEADAATLTQLMAMGGYPFMQVVGFLSSIQQGVATYSDSPTNDLAKQFLRAKVSDSNKDRLNKKEKMALALKGAALWVENKSVVKVKWNPLKESLPSNRPPIEFAKAA